jgi:hypothetical protein
VNTQAFPLRRGAIYGVIGAVGGALVPGAIAVVDSINTGALSAVFIAALLWAIVLGGAGFVLGACQPRVNSASSPANPAGGGSLWVRIGRWLYLLIVGGLMSFIIVGVISLVQVGLIVAMEAGDVSQQTRPTPLRRALMMSVMTMMVSSEVAGFLGTILGAFLGSTVRSNRPHPPVIRTAIFAGVCGTVLGGILGIAPGVLLHVDLEQARVLHSTGTSDIAFDNAWIFAILIGILAAIVAGPLARRLVQLRAPMGVS